MTNRQHNHLIELSGNGIVEEADCLTCQTEARSRDARQATRRKPAKATRRRACAMCFNSGFDKCQCPKGGR